MKTQNFIRHKVRPYDSLTSLAKRINISEENLKKFHNAHCGKMNRLWVTNLKGIEVVLIPTHFKTKEQQELHQRKMLPSENYVLHFHLDEYSVEENFRQPGKEDLKFNYTINLNIREKQGNLVATVDLKDHIKNGKTPDDKMSSLSLECMNNLYPISFQLSHNGVIASCFEHQNVVEKFKSKRKDIEDFYIGQLSKIYIDMFEHNVSDEDYFLRQMRSNLLYQIFFPNLKWFHQEKHWREKFTVYNNSLPLEFECKTESLFEDKKIYKQFSMEAFLKIAV